MLDQKDELVDRGLGMRIVEEMVESKHRYKL